MLDAKSFARPWPGHDYADELQNESAIVFGAYRDEQLVGAICARVVYDELWIFRIMTLPDFRRNKIATQLLQNLESLVSKSHGQMDMWLEVSVENTAAISFYEAEGFVKQYVRKEYYQSETRSNAKVDAMLMKRETRI